MFDFTLHEGNKMADNGTQDNRNDHDAASAENADSKKNIGGKMRDALAKAKDIGGKMKEHDFRGDFDKASTEAKKLADAVRQHDFRAEMRDAFAEAKQNPASIWKMPANLRPGKELAVVGLAVAVILLLLLAITSSSFFGFLCLLLGLGGLLFSILGLKTEGRKIAIGGAAVGLLVILFSLGQMFAGARIASSSRAASSRASNARNGQYEEYEGEAASDADEVLELAEAAKGLNVCGFYPGMSMANAKILAKHYNLADGDYRFQFNPVSGEVYLFRFSLGGACRMLDTPMPKDEDELKATLQLMVAELESQVGKFVGEDAVNKAWREAGSRDGFNVTLSLLEIAFDKIGALDVFDSKMQDEALKVIVPFYNNKRVAEKKAELEAAGLHPRVVQLARGIDMMLCSMYDGAVKIRGEDKVPKNALTFAKKTLMTSFEITEAQWEAVTGRQPLRSIGPAYPVKWGESGIAGEFVQYNQGPFLAMLNAMSYVKKLDLLFEIPEHVLFNTFATKMRIDGVPITSDNIDSVAWYRRNSGNSPHPAGGKQANIFGLYDVFGNMSEAINSKDGPVQFGGDYYDTAELLLSESPMEKLGTKRNALYQNFITLRLYACALDVDDADKGKNPYRGIELPGGIILPMKVINGDESVWWSIFEVTRAQWAAVMGSVPESDKEKAADGFIGLVALGSGGDDRWADKRHSPVVNVSWNDCQRFIAKLNELSATKEAGVVFDLPTEKEWKDACLAGSAGDYGRFVDGAEIEPNNVQDVAWFEKESDNRVRQPGDEFLEKMAKARSAHEVGWKSPNFNGLYDMLGNVAEWTSSASGDSRIVCGGKGDALPPKSDCKAAVKYPRNPDKGDAYLGLRLVARRKK